MVHNPRLYKKPFTWAYPTVSNCLKKSKNPSSSKQSTKIFDENNES